MRLYNLYWAPEGKCIAEGVHAKTGFEARRKAPAPYRTYRGEIYSVPCCVVCKEESGAMNTSLEGLVHKLGPTTHDFQLETTCKD